MMNTVDFLKSWMQARFNSDKGAALVEYALLLALIAVVCIVAIGLIGDNANDAFTSINSELESVTGP
jgi:pilus assembly protein Flp/PilA